MNSKDRDLTVYPEGGLESLQGLGLLLPYCSHMKPKAVTIQQKVRAKRLERNKI